MKAWYIFFIVFCAFICCAHSFVCYECGDAENAAECDSKQKIDNCTGQDKTCMKAHFLTANGKTGEVRVCNKIATCVKIKKNCEDGKEFQYKDGDSIMDCGAVCCITANDAEKPCNGTCRTTVVNRVLTIVVTIFVLKFFEQ